MCESQPSRSTHSEVGHRIFGARKLKGLARPDAARARPGLTMTAATWAATRFEHGILVFIIEMGL